MNAVSGAHNGKWQWSPSGAVNIGRPSDRRLPFETKSGSPGPGVWYASREPSCDQSNSATPSRYGFGCPPSVGTAQMPMSPPLEPLGLRTQNVTKEPSGENPSVRIDGLTSSGAPPCVKLWNCPEPTCVTHTSIGPSRSDRNATNCPSRETAAAWATPSKSVTVWNRAFAIGFRQKYSVFCNHSPAPITSATPAAKGTRIFHLLRGLAVSVLGGGAGVSVNAAMLSFGSAPTRPTPPSTRRPCPSCRADAGERASPPVSPISAPWSRRD